MWGDFQPPILVFVLIFVGAYRKTPPQASSTEHRSNKNVVRSVPSQQPKANAFVKIQYTSIKTWVMEEHNGAHNARKYEQAHNHSLPTMSTIKTVTIFKTKNVSPKLKNKLALARHVVGKTFHAWPKPNPPKKSVESHVRVIVP